MSPALHHNIGLYIKDIRRHLQTDESNDCLFLTINGDPLANSTVNKSLKAFATKTNELSQKTAIHLSSTMLRKSVVTNTRDLSSPQKNQLAQHMAHSRKTADRCYNVIDKVNIASKAHVTIQNILELRKPQETKRTPTKTTQSPQKPSPPAPTASPPPLPTLSPPNRPPTAPRTPPRMTTYPISKKKHPSTTTTSHTTTATTSTSTDPKNPTEQRPQRHLTTASLPPPETSRDGPFSFTSSDPPTSPTLSTTSTTRERQLWDEDDVVLLENYFQPYITGAKSNLRLAIDNAASKSRTIRELVSRKKLTT